MLSIKAVDHLYPTVQLHCKFFINVLLPKQYISLLTVQFVLKIKSMYLEQMLKQFNHLLILIQYIPVILLRRCYRTTGILQITLMFPMFSLITITTYVFFLKVLFTLITKKIKNEITVKQTPRIICYLIHTKQSTCSDIVQFAT